MLEANLPRSTQRLQFDYVTLTKQCAKMLKTIRTQLELQIQIAYPRVSTEDSADQTLTWVVMQMSEENNELVRLSCAFLTRSHRIADQIRSFPICNTLTPSTGINSCEGPTRRTGSHDWATTRSRKGRNGEIPWDLQAPRPHFQLQCSSTPYPSSIWARAKPLEHLYPTRYDFSSWRSRPLCAARQSFRAHRGANPDCRRADSRTLIKSEEFSNTADYR